MERKGWLRVAIAMTTAAWGGLQFAPMVLAYGEHRGLGDQLITGIFASYIVGLIPALLGAAWWSQTHGKRPMVRISMVLMLVGSLLLVAGSDQTWLLFAGRVVGGMGIGFIMGPGSAWVKELSADAPPGTGARRATIALTAGFAFGPLIAGLIAQWRPAPLHLPYAAHLVIGTLATVAVWNVPEAPPEHGPTPSVRSVARHVWQPWFLAVIVPAAPWVFGAPTVAYTILPVAVGELPGVPAIAASGVLAGITLGTSVLLQPTVKSYAVSHPRWVVAAGTAVAGVGMWVATATALRPAWWWLPLAAMVLGAAHGLVLVGCMTLVELRTPQHKLAAATAVAYCLTYIGFSAPYVVSTLSLLAPVWMVLAAGAVVASVTTLWIAALRIDA